MRSCLLAPRRRVASILAVSIAALLAGHSTQATPLYWDTNGTTAGSGAATGTWGTSVFWNTDSTGVAVPGTTLTTTADDLTFSAGSNGTAGTVTLSDTQGANSITLSQPGAITISGGTQINLGTGAITVNSGSGAHTISSVLNFASGNAITNNSVNALTIGGTNIGAGGVTVNGTGTIGIANNAAFGTGTLTLSGGTLQTSGAARTVANAIAATGGTTTTLNAVAGDLTFTNTLTGTGTIANNAGTLGSLVFTGDVSGFQGTFNYNDVNGGNNVSIGAINSAAANNFSQARLVMSGATTSTRNLTVAGATYTGAFQLGELSGTGGVLNIGDNAADSLQVGALNTSTSYTGLLQGIGQVVKVGTGTLTLGFANTYTGATTVNVGTLQAGVNSTATGGAFGLNSAVTTANTAGATLDLNNFNVTVGSLAGGGTTGGGVTLGSGTLTTGTGSASYAGDISGAGNLIKAGAGTQTLTGANTFGGTTTVNAGTLTLSGATGAIQSTSSITVNGNANLSLDNAAANADRILNTRTVTLNQNARLIMGQLAGTDSTEDIGTLALGFGDNIVTITSAANRVTTIQADSLTRTNNATALIRGSTLGGQATNVGRLRLDSLTGLTQVGTSTSATGSNGGTVKDLTIVPYLIGDTVVGNAGSNFVTYDTASGFRTLGANEQTTLVAGTTTGVTRENVKGGNVVLANSLAVNSLLLNNAGTLNGTSTTLTVDSGAVATVGNIAVTLGNGFSGITLGNGTVNEGIFNVTANTTTVAAPISVTGSGGLTKAGPGTLILSASNLYAGQTTINQGTLTIGSGTTGDLGSNTANIVLTTGTTLTFGRTNAGLILANNISGGGAVTQGTAGGTTLLSGTNTYSGQTSITNGTLQFNGGAAMSANSALALSNTGTTDTGAIKLALRSNTNDTFTLGGGNFNMVGNATIGATVFYNIDVNNITSGTNNTLTLAGTVNATNGGTNGIAQINVTGGNGYTLALGNYNQSSANGNGVSQFNVASGVTLTLARILGASQSSNANFLGAGNTTILGAIGKDGNTARNLFLNFNQTGTVTLNAAFGPGGSDAPSFNSGTVVYNNAAATSNTAINLGNATASSTAAANVLLGGSTGLNGGLTYTGAINARDTTSGLLTVGGQNTSGTNTFNNANTVTLGVTTNVGKNINLVAATGGQVDFTGVVRNNGTDTTAGITINNPYTVNAATVTPGGIVRLSGANTYRGTTTIAGGILLADSANALNTTALGGNVTFIGGTLRYGVTFGAGANADISARIKNSTAAVAIDTNSQTRTFASAVDSTNLAGLTKLGAGTLNLTTANTYIGDTTIGAGTLAVSLSGTLGTGNVAVASGANFGITGLTASSYNLSAMQTLSGAGTVLATGKTLLASGTISPGSNSTDTLTVNGGTLELDSTSKFVFELGDSAIATQNDLISLTNTATLALGSSVIGFSDFNFTGNAGFGNGTYVLFSGATTLSGALDGGDLTGSIGGFTGTLSLSGNNVELLVVPEPGSAVSLLGGLGMLLGLQRFRRRMRARD